MKFIMINNHIIGVQTTETQRSIYEARLIKYVDSITKIDNWQKYLPSIKLLIRTKSYSSSKDTAYFAHKTFTDVWISIYDKLKTKLSITIHPIKGESSFLPRVD